jgi:peptidyl-prolyl cis-trans isomerase SurA
MPALLLRAFVATALVLCPVLASAQSLRVVARVNDEAITDFDLKERIVFAVKSSGLQDTPDIHQRLAPQILRQMIDEKLQVQNAKALGLAPSDGEVAARVSEIEHSAGMAPGTFKA